MWVMNTSEKEAKRVVSQMNVKHNGFTGGIPLSYKFSVKMNPNFANNCCLILDKWDISGQLMQLKQCQYDPAPS